MTRRVQIRLDPPRRLGHHRRDAELDALAGDAELQDSFPLLRDLQCARFFPAQVTPDKPRRFELGGGCGWP